MLKIGFRICFLFLAILSCRSKCVEQLLEVEEKVESASPDIILDREGDILSSRIGEFSYVPPNARFRDCVTDSIYQVIPASNEYSETTNYATLLEFYTTSAPEMGLGLYVELKGYDAANVEDRKDTMISIVPVSYKILTKEETACW